MAKNGKPVAHILDLIFPDIAHPTDEKPQSISNRRINRRILKNKLQTRCCPSQILEQAPWELIELNILPFVADVMEERRILKDDIQQVLYSAEEIGSWFEHGENGSSTAYLKLGAVTFWVLYKKVGKQYHIENCWSHRMIIQGGPL